MALWLALGWGKKLLRSPCIYSPVCSGCGPLKSHLPLGNCLAMQRATSPSGTAPLLAGLGRLRAAGVASQPQCRELAVLGCTLPQFQCSRGASHPAKPQHRCLDLLRSLGMRKNGINMFLPGCRVSWSSSTLRWRIWCTWGTTT